MNNLTLRCLEDWNKTSIDLFVPLSLDPQIDLALLKCDFLGAEGEVGTLDEGSEVMAVDANVLVVQGWFGLST